MEKREKVIIGVTIISIVAIIYIIAFMEDYEYIKTFRDVNETIADEELRTTYKEAYDDVWDLGYLSIDDEKHDYNFNIDYQKREIEAIFMLKDEDAMLSDSVLDDNAMKSMSEACNAVKAVINEYLGDEYSFYPVKILFREADLDTHSFSTIIIEYTSRAQTMKIYLEDSDVTLSKIAETFPEINEIETTKLYYDSIEEIKGFNDLRKIDVLNNFTEDEMEYILSIFPDCEIYNGKGE